MTAQVVTPLQGEAISKTVLQLDLALHALGGWEGGDDRNWEGGGRSGRAAARPGQTQRRDDDDDVFGSGGRWCQSKQSKLCVDPGSFKESSCIRDLTRACEKNDIVKVDQLFFTIVHQDHWAVVVLNFMLKQFNVFDSNREDPDYVNNLDKPCHNLIENFKTLVRERNPWKHDLDTFECLSPSGYPRQSTTYDCGIFAILYMENLTAKGMKSFATDSNSLLNYRKYLAAKLFKHPQNTLSSEDEFQALLKKS